MAVAMRDIHARHVDTRRVVMTVMAMMVMAMMTMTPILDIGHNAGGALLNRGRDARGQRGRSLRLRCGSRNDEQAANSEQAEKFSDEHQCSPSGVM